jgi:hypothetical protein
MAGPDRDDVLARINLADVLTSEIGPPKRLGSEWRWGSVDPAREGTGKTPPTHIFTTTAAGVELFKDFTTGLSGTAIDVIMIRRRVDFATALDTLAHQAGLTNHPTATGPAGVGRRQPAAGPVPRRPGPGPGGGRAPARAPSPELVAWVEECAERLWADTRPAARARAWLTGRGYTTSCLADALVGYDPGARADRQRPRPERARHGIPNMAGITLPIFNPAGQVVYAQTRSLTWTPDSDYPKYVNPTGIINPGIGTWITRHRDRSTYQQPGYQPGRGRPGSGQRGGGLQGSSRAGAPVIVVEGPTDALAAHQVGYDVAGLIGAGLAAKPATATDLVDAFGLDRPYVVLTDPDPAGRLAGHLLVVHLWRAGAAAIHRSPPAGDVADWAQTETDAFPDQLACHLNKALAELTTATRHALNGDPACIDLVAGSPLEPAAHQAWTAGPTPPHPIGQPATRRSPAQTQSPSQPRASLAQRPPAARRSSVDEAGLAL